MYGLSDYFPRIGLRSGSERELKVLGANPGKYICMGIAVSAILGLLLSLFLGPVLFPILFGLLLGLFIIMPRMEMRRIEGAIESELPWFLRGLGMLVELGIPFEKALGSAAEGKIAKEIERTLGQSERGMSLQAALSSFGNRYRSLEIKRAVSQLCLCYESGSRGREIIKIGEDMLALQKHRLREFSAKSALIGLLFIMTSIVIPTFFLVYASAGSYAFGSEVSSEELSLAMLVLFPMMSVFVLVLSKGMMPRDQMDEGNFDYRVLAPAGIAVLGGVMFPELIVFFLAAGILVGAVVAAKTYPGEKRREEVERRLPDAILSIGSLPKSAGMTEIFRIIRRGEFGALSDEAEISEKQLSMNVRGSIVLEDLWKRNRSRQLRRAATMLERMVDTCSLERMGLLADDLVASAEIVRERARMFSMQKYTLILGALLMPLIMSMMLSLLEGMGDGLGISADVITGYIVIYAAIASSAISWFEGKKSVAAIYLFALAVSGLAVFHFLSF